MKTGLCSVIPPRLAALLLAALVLLLAAPALAAAPANPDARAYVGFFPIARPSGTLPVTLVPHPSAVARVVPVSFGVPFPPGCLRDPNNLALFDNSGGEMPIHVTVLARWQPPVPGAPSIRAVLVQYLDLMATAMPRTYTLRWGKPRRENRERGFPPDQGWFPVADGSYPAFRVKDPVAWAMFPASWLGQSLVKSRLAPAGAYPSFHWLERARAGFFKQAINKPILIKRQAVQKNAKKRYGVDYVNDYKAWLFDRTTTIFLNYLTTGKLEPLAYALRDVQYYASKIKPDGNFAMRNASPGANVEYGNQEALAIGWFLTGLPRLKQAALRLTKLLDAWNPEYSPSRSFWTERHLSFHIMIATAGYEITGDPALLARARRGFEIGYNMQTNPPPGAPRDGCLIHTGKQHSAPVKGWTCSPWMSVLFVDAALRYYIVSADPRVPQSILMLADYMVKQGTYRYKAKNAKRVETLPYYLASSAEQSEKAVSTDRMHCLDTSKIMAAAIYFARKQGKPYAHYQKLLNELFVSAKMMLPPVRPGRKTPYTLNPSRKFSWWFRPTADLPWLLNQK
ncbi:MAG: hypothetical protein KQH53_12340 [Desulfarculaceae bacterium]|nr:hypothetical protein [Desulfarculaceae bacterium]